MIKNAKKIDEARKMILPSRKKSASPKKGKYTALVAMVGKNRDVKVKVILLKIDNGKLIFWSMYVLVFFFQIMFMGIIKTRRPTLLEK